MPGTFQLVLDTTGPQGVTLSLDVGADPNDLVVDATCATTDPDTTGYQVKLWGDVDPAADPNVQIAEVDSAWIALTPTIAVTLSGGDGAKTVNMRMRDDVWNTSSVATDTIAIDTTAPVITIVTGPDVPKISKVAGKDSAVITWKADSDLQAYKIKVVPSTGSLENAGTTIPVAAGSQNMTGGAVAANAIITSTIHGTDLEAASTGDGSKTVKVFGQDLTGNWSVV